MSLDFYTDQVPARGENYNGEKAAGYRLIIELDGVKKDTGSGLVAYTDEEYTRWLKSVNTGCVVSVGEYAYQGSHFQGPWCKLGDRVRFQLRGGDLITMGGKYYKVINDEDVFTILGD